MNSIPDLMWKIAAAVAGVVCVVCLVVTWNQGDPPPSVSVSPSVPTEPTQTPPPPPDVSTLPDDVGEPSELESPVLHPTTDTELQEVWRPALDWFVDMYVAEPSPNWVVNVQHTVAPAIANTISSIDPTTITQAGGYTVTTSYQVPGQVGVVVTFDVGAPLAVVLADTAPPPQTWQVVGVTELESTLVETT